MHMAHMGRGQVQQGVAVHPVKLQLLAQHPECWTNSGAVLRIAECRQLAQRNS